MQSAKERERTFFYFPTKAKNETARHWLSLKDFIIHEVGKLKVVCFNKGNDVVVINEESLKIHFFDNEEEAMNFCLDVYPETKINKQGDLFTI